MNIIDTFDITPDTNLIDVIGNAGYTFDFAIADLIDNCISAKANKIVVFLDILSKNPYIYILDNGIGMNFDELKKSAIIGNKDIDDIRSESDLGRYSTGLKSATKSFCKKIYIISKKNNDKINTILLDYEMIKDKKEWKAFVVDNFDKSNILSGNGTLIYCDNINLFKGAVSKEIAFEKINLLEVSLSHIFSKYIKKGLQIIIKTPDSKDILIKEWNPFSLLENKSTKIICSSNVKYKNSTVSFKAYILPPYNNLSPIDQQYMTGKGLNNQQGFYIYRNDRLIKEGGWLDLPGFTTEDKSKYARIEVCFNSCLDKEFSINFEKNSISIPDDLYKEFRDIATKAKKESHNNFNYVKHPETRKTIKKECDNIWKITNSNMGMVLSVNESHPLIKSISMKLTSNEIKMLLSALSKSLPISMIQSQETTTVSYTENEINNLLKEVIINLKKEGLNTKEIKKKLCITDPFKDYKDLLIKYFDEHDEE